VFDRSTRKFLSMTHAIFEVNVLLRPGIRVSDPFGRYIMLRGCITLGVEVKFCIQLLDLFSLDDQNGPCLTEGLNLT
jgi:hypothetical protein